MPQAFIFIPDIGGFTRFVNETEINHAQHIISELLEVIIDSNQLGLSVSEVEGDAVLFYRLDIPEIEKILEQTRQTFLNFHEHLRRYEHERICQCGACTSAANLTLKIVAHCGEIGFTRVKDVEKPFGSPLVQSHRLLKNSVSATEYLLITDVLMGTENPDSWSAVTPGSNMYDGEEIAYKSINLAPLRDQVPEPPTIPSFERMKNPIRKSIIIDKPLYLVFEMVNNLDFRLLWQKDLNDLEYEKNRLNRVGTKHRCLFEGGFADFETVKGDFGEDALVYGEKLEKVPIAKEVVIYYVLREVDQQTELTMEGHFRLSPLLGFLAPLVRKKLTKGMNNTLTEFEEVINSTDTLAYPDPQVVTKTA